MRHENGYLTARSVKERFGGISDMALWRWLHSDTINFPKPIYISRRRYWKETDILAFEERVGDKTHAA